MATQSLSLGNFELIEVLQVNEGFAVALCKDPVRNARVVCKTAASTLPTDEQVASLKHEYELALKAQGEGVVKLLGLEQGETGSPILVFEYFSGTRLEMGSEPIPTPEYLALFSAIAKALGYIHSKKIIHRDLNPDNILWDRKTKEVRIIDFNLATDMLSETVRSDAIESLCGTLPFISPEQTGRMNRKVDFRSDYYSLGMTFYHMLAGQSPFQAIDAMGWVYCHITEQAPLLSERYPHVPRAVALIIDKMLAKNAEDRYQSSYGLIRDLELVAECLKNRKSDEFIPGQFDVSERLIIPEKLYGRENELSTFLAFFDRVKDGQKFMCTIAGSSGMGKSVLVNEVNKPVIEARGAFISGKCDQYKRNMPYSAIKPALGDLIRQYLAKPNDEIEFLRRQIEESIGPNVQVITEIVPELEAITGPLPLAPKLAPNEARMRFQKSFELLIKIFTAGGKPLVAFLDDLQWSDIPSLKLIEFLMLEADLTSFMIVAVFRDNEVLPGHPLLASLEEIKKDYELPTIKLSPLSKLAIGELLGDTFRCPAQRTMEFADILFNKTAGNPFHITEMIKTLNESESIYFDMAQGKWLWDVQKIAAAGMSNDVVELMVATLQKCPARAQERLKLAACVGASFDLNILATVSGISQSEALEDLWVTIEKGLIIPLGESYKLLKLGMASNNKQFLFKFQHDRVHEAAYLLIPESERPKTHLNIGRLLSKIYGGRDLENQIMEVVRHYNLAPNLLKSAEDRLEVCQLNLLAASKSRNSVAYEASLYHLKLAKGYLPESPWTEQYALSLKINMQLSEVAFLLGDLDLAEATNRELLSHVRDELDRADVNGMRMDQRFSAGKLLEARDIGIQSIRALGLKFPLKVSKITVLKHIFAMKRRLKATALDKVLEGKKLEDRKIRLILKQIVALNPIFFALGERPSSAVSVLENLRLSLEYGICPESAYGFVGSASIFGNLLGNLELGSVLGKISLDIDEKFVSVSARPAIYHIYTSFIAPFNMNLDRVSEYAAMTIEAGLAAGDLYFLPIAAGLCQTYRTHVNLTEVCEKDESYYLHLTESSNNLKCHEMALVLYRFRLSLLKTQEPAEIERHKELNLKSFKVFEAEQFMIGRFVYDAYVGIEAYLTGDYQTALRHLKEAYDKCFQAVRGTFHETEYHFYHALTVARVYSQLSKDERKSADKRMKVSFKRMKLLSAHNAHNFMHRYVTMQAEWLRVKGKVNEAADLFEKALESVSRKFLCDLGVINEVCARFYLDNGKKRLAHLCIQDSFNSFRSWGAERKTAQLVEQWPVLKQNISEVRSSAPRGSSVHSIQMSQGTNRGIGHQSLDMMTITRASQTLSGQVEMSGLVMHLMKIIVENAGAHYAVLMLKDKNSSHTQVISQTLNNETILLQEQTLSHFVDISLSVMLYTSRVNETVIIDDVGKDEKYKSDPYFLKHHPKSILAMPIKSKGQVIGYFYLENRMLTGSFTKERVEVLNILGTQAAISLENAQLYANLEQKVKERTVQLAEKNRDIRTILANIKQGILTITPDLSVHPEYSQFVESILETKSIANQPVMNLIFDQSDLSSDKKDQVHGALDFSIQQDLLCFESNGGSLVRECRRKRSNGEEQFLELDWDPIINADDLVEKIMLTVRDVTEVRKLRDHAEKNQKVLTMLSQILNAGSDRFQAFIKNSSTILNKAAELIKQAGPDDQELVNTAYRHLHTVKGNARSLALTELTSLVHECESILVHMRSGSVPFVKSRLDVLDYIQRIFGAIHHYQQLYTEKLLSYNATGHAGKANRLLERLESKMEHWEKAFPELGGELRKVIQSLNHQTLQELVDVLRDDAAQLAGDVGKEAPNFKVVGAELTIDVSQTSLLTNAFIHLFSNAVNHGLETSSQRLAAKKAAQGTIYVEARDLGQHLQFMVYDDGKGLNLEAIRATALARGFIRPQDDLSDHELAMMIFKSGVSTADSVSQSAGRGVGMDAIRDMVHEAGGELELLLDPGSENGRRSFKVLFTLPKPRQAQVQEAA